MAIQSMSIYAAHSVIVWNNQIMLLSWKVDIEWSWLQVQHGQKLLTVFSSSKYCNGSNEAACVLADNNRLRLIRLDTSWSYCVWPRKAFRWRVSNINSVLTMITLVTVCLTERLACWILIISYANQRITFSERYLGEREDFDHRWSSLCEDEGA